MINKIEKNRLLQGFSPFVILGVVMILVPIFVLMTMDNIREQNGRTMEKLTGKGIFLIRAFEAGTRTGMITMRWGGSRVQNLLTETALQPEVEYMMITDSSGTILAHSDSERVGKRYENMPDIKKLNSDSLFWHRELTSEDGKSDNRKKVFQVFKLFTPARRRFVPGVPPVPICIVDKKTGEINCENGYLSTTYDKKHRRRQRGGASEEAEEESGHNGKTETDSNNGRNVEREDDSTHRIEESSTGETKTGGRGVMEMDWFRMHFFPPPPNMGIVPEDQQNQIIFAALDMSEVDIAKQKYLRHVIAMGFMFFVLGSTGIMGILALQGYRSARSSISELKGEIERSRRLAAVGKLAAGVAHEIRNPLSSIKGFATYFRERYSNVEDDKEVADIMIQEVERLNRAVTQLLEFAKPLPVMLKEVDIRELISHSIKLIEYDLTQKGITFEVDNRLEMDNIVTDPDRLNQILLNLYLNAMQAMDANGKLTIRLSAADRGSERERRSQSDAVKRTAANKIREHNVDSRKRILLEIIDTGKGIDEKDIEHIFDPYFTNRPGGTGLGLAMVYRAVEALGAEIQVESSLGRGTTFSITLPSVMDQEDLNRLAGSSVN